MSVFSLSVSWKVKTLLSTAVSVFCAYLRRRRANSCSEIFRARVDQYINIGLAPWSTFQRRLLKLDCNSKCPSLFSLASRNLPGSNLITAFIRSSCLNGSPVTWCSKRCQNHVIGISIPCLNINILVYKTPKKRLEGVRLSLLSLPFQNMAWCLLLLSTSPRDTEKKLHVLRDLLKSYKKREHVVLCVLCLLKISYGSP